MSLSKFLISSYEAENTDNNLSKVNNLTQSLHTNKFE
jgi:hypothetical protein